MDEVLNEEKTNLYFPNGLYGFESFTNFTLAPSEVESILRLQSDEDDALSFFLVDPFLFFNTYEIDVDDDTVALLEIDNPEDVYVLAIITIAKVKPAVVTANLQGPVVINRKNNKACQIVLLDTKWKTKHNIFESGENG